MNKYTIKGKKIEDNINCSLFIDMVCLCLNFNMIMKNSDNQ